MGSESRIIIAPGARKAEEVLLEEVKTWVQKVKEDLTLLGNPLRIVVPSKSLREHVAAALVRRVGKGLAGVKVQTLHSLALEIIQRAGMGSPREGPIVEVLIRRNAEREDDLTEALGFLEEGMGEVVGTVVDLIEAGMEPAHLEAVEEVLDQSPCGQVGEKKLARAKAILKVAAETLKQMEELKVGLQSTVFGEAKKALEEVPDSIPLGSILIHGFADATGLALDFLEFLLRHSRCTVIMDHPPQPGRWEVKDPGAIFTGRFFNRLEPHANIHTISKKSKEPKMRIFKANGRERECFLVAGLIQELILSGCRPEEIGVVARQLEPYSPYIRKYFGRLAVPFSGISGASFKSPTSRSIDCLLEICKKRDQSPAEMWLELLAWNPNGEETCHKSELVLGSRCLGAITLEDLALLDTEKISSRWEKGYPLPFTMGLEEREKGTARTRKIIPTSVFEQVAKKAKATLKCLNQWTQMKGPISLHANEMWDLLAHGLGWDPKEGSHSIIQEALEALEEGVPKNMDLDQGEFLLLLERELREILTTPLGGRGGGVQVLEVMDARGRTFEHLFLLGLNRDVFPRIITEDPLLPDSLRHSISTILPDIPIKERGFEEERYLFAQLVSCSANVTITFLAADDDGKAMSPSPFVERLVLAEGLEILKAEEVIEAKIHGNYLLPATQRAILLGLQGKRDEMAALLNMAMEEVFGQEALFPKENAAKARLRVLDELDPDLRTSGGSSIAQKPGPYMGFVGVPLEEADPRNSTPYVTTLERTAECPWLVLLTRILRIEYPPDPMEAVAEISYLEVGQMVHRVLEAIVVANKREGKLCTTLAEAKENNPAKVPWPNSEELEDIMREKAQEILLERGIRFPFFADFLVKRAKPYLDTARETDWEKRGGELDILGVELEGALELEEGEEKMTLRFRADRADITPDALILTDYKTGRPISEKVKEETNLKHFLKEVARGRRLQAAAYTLARYPGKKVMGRYLFLKPGLDHWLRELWADPRDEELISRFKRSVEVLLRAWRYGVFFPRLMNTKGEKENDWCERCEFFMACYRGDSGFRARLLEVAQRARSMEEKEPMRTFSLLWSLGEKPEEKLNEEER